MGEATKEELLERIEDLENQIEQLKQKIADLETQLAMKNEI